MTSAKSRLPTGVASAPRSRSKSGIGCTPSGLRLGPRGLEVFLRQADRLPQFAEFLGNAFLKLAINQGKLKVAGYFDMDNTVAESDRDEDLGSGGAMVLPPMILPPMVLPPGRNPRRY